MNRTTFWCLVGGLLVSLPQAGMALAPLPQYYVTDLGLLPGADSSYAGGINDKGEVTGGSGNRVFLWKPQTGMQDLGTPGGYFTAGGVAINENGQIAVGASQPTYPPFVGGVYRWQSGAYQNLAGLGGTYSSAYGIDAQGRVAGMAYTSTGGIHAYRTTGNSMVDIDSLGGDYSLAYGINANGIVVGEARNSQQEYHAFVWSGSGSMQDLGTLGGTQSRAQDISDSGIIVGDSSTANNSSYRAFILQNGVMTNLGSLAAGSSYGQAVNNQGQVIGTFSDGQYGYPYLWTSSTGMLALNSLMEPVTGAGWSLLSADDINNNGQIVGYGFHGSGGVRAFLLTPVPEPGSVVLLVIAAGAFGLSGARGGRRRS